MEGKVGPGVLRSNNKHDHAIVKQEHKHKGDRDRQNETKPSCSKPGKLERNFIEVNYSYETNFKEGSRDVLGTPLV